MKLISDGSGGHSVKSHLASELSEINVGPALVGKRGPRGPRRTIDLPPGAAAPLEPVQSKGPDGEPIVSHVPKRSPVTG